MTRLFRHTVHGHINKFQSLISNNLQWLIKTCNEINFNKKNFIKLIIFMELQIYQGENVFILGEGMYAWLHGINCSAQGLGLG